MVKISNTISDAPQKRIAESFEKFIGESPSQIVPLTAQGSPRRYFRVSGDGITPCVAVYSADVAENEKFRALSELFSKHGIKVPKVFWISPDKKVYFQEDLGDVSLYSILKTEQGEEFVKKAISEIAKVHSLKRGVWEQATTGGGLTSRQIMWDANYFKYEFLKPSGVLFSENLLEDDFERLRKNIEIIPEEYIGFMYRDFQSRNVMVHQNESWLIDFQGGGTGQILYDLVSFLWQARAGFNDEFRNRMLEYYISRLSELRGEDMSGVLNDLPLLRLFRCLQVLGAYGLRGLVEHKAAFVQSIPAALNNLNELLECGAIDSYPELKRISHELCGLDRFKSEEKFDGLTVKVFSFSYKKGYPEDLTGNGGGFMFDCRGMTNPGRFEEYKQLTGLDSEVKDFLEERGEVQQFVSTAVQLVSPTIDKYIARGFSSLQIGFGCTGGQHRSVYCAESLAMSLKKRYPGMKIIINHREQSIRREL